MSDLYVVTKVSGNEGGGNLALPTDLYYEVEQPDDRNRWLGRYESAIRPLGAAWLALRAPVFRLGEILVLDENDRDQFGRKPSKWDVEVEAAETIDEARGLARKARATA